MKGLILAGGFATRLRPLSCSKPKLLFPLVGIPLIDRMMDWLALGNVREVVLGVNHLSDKLRTEVAARKLGNRIALSVEETPLGTGGPLRLAEPLLSNDDPVVVVNGDVATDIDLGKLTRFHLQSGAEATISIFSVKDTRPFGLVTIDSKDQIVDFEEKSPLNKGPGWINAGVYVLNRSVIDMIPVGRAVSLEREIFPILAEQSTLRGWKHAGFWYDIGKIKDYVTANMELLSRPGYVSNQSEGLASHVGVQPPSYLSDDCVIEKDAKIGPQTILSPKVKVRKGAMIRDSIVFEESVLGENCRVEGSVIGEATTIGKGAVIEKGSVIAGEVVVPEGTIVDPESIILN
jgi:mannose-1-phosphate guanylyltransferase